MKILMSAFACCPGRGSEPGVGWNWALEAARLGHEVKVLTRTSDRNDIEREIKAGRVPVNLDFEFIMPAWLERLRIGGIERGFAGITMQVVHLLWQFVAYAHLRRGDRVRGYDIIHHITYGGIRHPTLLGRLPVPLVLGPLGGGERVPYALRKSMHWRGWLLELMRDVHTWCLRLDPITRSACRDAVAIYAITEESRTAFPVRFRDKITVHSEIGIHEVPPRSQPSKKTMAPLKLIYVGRFLNWKGMALGLRAVAKARRSGVDVQLTMVGSGPEEPVWRQLATELCLSDAVTWRGYVPHCEIGEAYGLHDALLFPSLHDSSGNVILEAFANGLPVICLALGGPGELVNNSCGRVVPVEGANEHVCTSRLAEAIQELALSRAVMDDLSKGAKKRAQQFRWSEVVSELYSDVERRLEAEKLM